MKLTSYTNGNSDYPELGQFNKAELDDLISRVAFKIDWDNCGLFHSVNVSTTIEYDFFNSDGIAWDEHSDWGYHGCTVSKSNVVINFIHDETGHSLQFVYDKN